jgi:nucleotide-binding universal stress UspA family protein
MTILICYDGSADAQAAIDKAAELMPGSDAVVLVIWETILETMTRDGAFGMGFGMLGSYEGESADAAIKKGALDTASDGARRATSAGLVAVPRIRRRSNDIAAVMLSVADEIDADLIALGTRGFSGVKSLMMGSVSHAVLHHADRPVMVVPSPELAEQRLDWAERARVTAEA